MLSFVVCLMTFFSFANSQPATKQEKKILKPERKTNEPAPKKKRDPEIESLVVEIQSLPPEFASDFLIRIATSEKVKEKAWKLELLEDAFQMASKAQYQYKRSGIYWIDSDTRTGLMGYAHEEKLEMLSLQCRVVQALLSLDTHKAREIFEQIPTIKLPALSCKDTLIEDVSDYYITLADVANKAFSTEEIRREEHINFMSYKLSQINSPLQIGTTATTIQTLNLKPDQLFLIVTSFINSIKKIQGDDRSFSQAMLWGASTHSVATLIDKCEANKISGVELLKVYRTFLVTHLSSTRCSDFENFHNGVSQTVEAALNDYVRWRDDLYKARYTPITADEIKPTKVNEKAEVFEYWQSAPSKQLVQKLVQLRFGVGAGEKPTDVGETPLTIEQRSETKWYKQLDEFLLDFAKWQSDSEKSDADYFHQKCILFTGLSELTPPGASRDMVLREFVNFLNQSNMQRDNPIEWYQHVKRLLTNIIKAGTLEQKEILESMKNTGSPSLNALVRMESITPNLTKAETLPRRK